MKKDEYFKLIKDWVAKIEEISTKKGHDYAKESDHIVNFKNTHLLCKMLDIDPRRSPADVANFFRVIKMGRIANLHGRDPQNESVIDSELDDLNYHFLYLACKGEVEQKDVTR